MSIPMSLSKWPKLDDEDEEWKLILTFLKKMNLEDYFEEYLIDPGAAPPERGIADPCLRKLFKWINLSSSKDPDISILDIGCGQGRLLSLLANLKVNSLLPNIHYVGIDCNTERLDKAREFAEKTDFYGILSSAEFYQDIEEVKNYVKEHTRALQRPFRFNYVFLINVLHEIVLEDLPLLLEYLTFWLNHHGYLAIQEMSVLPKAEVRYIPWNLPNLSIMFSRPGLQVDWKLYKSSRGLPIIYLYAKKIMEDREYIDYDDWRSHLLEEVIPSMKISVEYLRNQSRIIGNNKAFINYRLAFQNIVDSEEKLSSRLPKRGDFI